MLQLADFRNGVYAIGFTGLYAGVTFLWWGIDAAREARSRAAERATVSSQSDRLKLADDARERRSPAARYAVSAVGFLVAAVVLSHRITPSIGYALLCLALVARCITDQVVEERAPRRRSALLGRSRHVDPVLLGWIVIAALASLILIPFILDPASRLTAATIALCISAMLAVSWRIASAPPILSGDDLEAEQVVDSETRAIRTGNTCVLSLAALTAFVFISGLPGGVDRLSALVPPLAGAVLLGWKTLYARSISRTSLAS
ncbi:MAG TPA: hypothetical protein VFN49_02390 [Candidatus Aquilonibacter sp.]|nr:hypothetical protein [Candidatus Aquilonibacter sp.]